MKNIYARIIGTFLLLLISLFALGQNSLVDSLNQKAYQVYREDAEEGKRFAYQALTLAQAQDLSPQIVDSYINLSRCFRLQSNWDSAYQILDLAIQLGKEIRYTEGLMNATNNLAICYLTQGKPAEASPFLKQSLTHAQAIDNAKGQANAYNNLAIIAENYLEYDSALMYLEGALSVYQQIKDSTGIARIYLNQAFLFDSKQENDSAIVYSLKALRIQDELGLSYQQANTYNQIGELYHEKENLAEARKHYQSALSLFEQIGDVSGQATAYNNIGSILYDTKAFTEAEKFLTKGLELAQKTEEPFIIGSSLVNLANLYRKQDRSPQLIESHLLDAIPYLESSNSYALSDAYYGLGLLYSKQKKRSIAKGWFEKSLESAIYFEDHESQKLAYLELSKFYQAQGNHEKALNYLQQYQTLHDSLVNLESRETINQLNIEYESEKKEKENLILQNDLTNSKLATAEQKALRNQLMGIAAIVLLLGLGGFIWFRYRQRIRIKEQEIELEQERIVKEQRQKEAEKLRELDAMKTRFFTNISHEFRTPLTLIIGKNEQLKKVNGNASLDSGFDMVGRNGHRLLDLVNQVLDVAKLEAGGMDLEISRLDAISFLKHMLYSFESMAQERGIELFFNSDLQEQETAFDLKKIERVIFNLLSNAIKFTPEAGKIEMSVLRSNDQLSITVADTGFGIKASQLPYIFDRFYQADSSENQAQPGTGIGLSLVKELVELHQGKIEVQSELDKGTTFEITLPIPANLDEIATSSGQMQLSPEALPNKSTAEDSLSLVPGTRKERILLIEDNTDVRAFVKEQILSFGYQVEEAKDGVEGLEKAQEIIPDLIISDIMMPRLDGYGVAKGLKADERTSHIPVVLLTSKASDESKIAGLELGVDDYLLKPFNVKELEVRIANLIEQRKRLRERFSSATIIRPNEVSAVSMDQVFLKKVLDNIEENLTNEQFSVEVLGEKVGLSVNHLNRKLSALIDQTAGKLIRSMRLQRAADLIKQRAATISEIAYDTGFSSPAHFTRSFNQQFGMSPTAYQKQEG